MSTSFWEEVKRSGEKLRRTFDERRKQTLEPEEIASMNVLPPTSNARNEALIAEAEAFPPHLRAVHKSILKWDRYTDGGLRTLRAFLTSPLPRAHVDTNGQVSGPVTMVGAGVDLTAFNDATGEMGRRFRRDVLNQIEDWLDHFKLIKQKNAKLEDIRLDLDRKRRTLLHVEAKLLRYEQEGRSTEKVVQRKLVEEGKVNRIRIKFDDVENQIYADLIKLFADAAALRQCAKVAIEIMQNTYNQCHAAFEGHPAEAVAYVAALPVPPSPVRQTLPPSTTATPRMSMDAPLNLRDSQAFQTPMSAGGAADTTLPTPPAWYPPGELNGKKEEVLPSPPNTKVFTKQQQHAAAGRTAVAM